MGEIKKGEWKEKKIKVGIYEIGEKKRKNKIKNKEMVRLKKRGLRNLEANEDEKQESTL